MVPVVLSGGPASLGSNTLLVFRAVLPPFAAVPLVRSAPRCSPSTAELSMQHMEFSTDAKLVL